jgi:hypothetical protein
VAVMSSAVQRMVAQPQLFLLGFIQSLFESSMSATCCPHVYSTARAVTLLHVLFRLHLDSLSQGTAHPPPPLPLSRPITNSRFHYPS